MVAAAKHNQEPLRGSFGEPLRMSQSVTLTVNEQRGLKKMAAFRSVAATLRSLIPPEKLEQLARLGAAAETRN